MSNHKIKVLLLRIDALSLVIFLANICFNKIFHSIECSLYFVFTIYFLTYSMSVFFQNYTNSREISFEKLSPHRGARCLCGRTGFRQTDPAVA